MILTDRFVFIHYPKTGGTFVTQVIRRIHKKDRSVLGRLWGRVAGFGYVDLNKHGACTEIPPEGAGRAIVSTMRNPYDRYVSEYEYAWWKRHPQEWIDWPAMKKAYPSCPDFTFAEFVEIMGSRFGKFAPQPVAEEKRLGFHSETFVRLFFRDPEAAWARIDDAYIAARGWEKDMFPVRFFRMEALNGDLHAFLSESGYPEERIAFIPEEGKILPEGSKRKQDRPWQEYYTPELKAAVRRRERLLFAMFPEYDRP